MRYMIARAVALLLAILLVGCGGAAAQPTPTPPADASAIIEQSRNAMLRLTNYQAAIAMSLAGDGGGDVAMQVVMRGSPVNADASEGLRFRGEVMESSLPALPVGTVAVLGDENVIYDPVQKVVLRGGPGIGGSELFNLFLGSQVRVVTLLQPELAEATLAGEEQVGDYATTRIDLAPRADLAAAMLMDPSATATVWIDQATNLPVQFDYRETGTGLRWTASDLDITSEISDEQLAFTPPDDATVVAGGELGEIVSVATVEEAAQEAGFTPLTPSYLPEGLPAEPSSAGVQQTPLGPLVTLSYGVQSAAEGQTDFEGIEDVAPQTTRGITIQALQGAANLPVNLPTGAVVSEVSVRGNTAVQAVLGDGQASLTWKEGDVFYTVRSNGFGSDEVLKVAESME
jgi:hypothetical protein